MLKWICPLLLTLLILPNYVWCQEKMAICLRDFDTPPDVNLDYVVKGINRTIINRLSQFSEIKAYPAEGKYFNEPEKILESDKVQLLPIRRETGFDGLIFGKVENSDAGLRVTMHLVDFSSGRIYFSGTFEGSFGSMLLSKLEEKIALYADALISYYDCILDVTSEPIGAEVWVNGGNAGLTPISKLDVKDGKTMIQVKKKGYAPYETEIELKSGQKGSIHAVLYDLLVDHLRSKKSRLQIDSHSFGIVQTLDIQNLDEIGIDSINFSNYRYQAKFGRLYMGFGIGSSRIDATQKFDTFLGISEGYEDFTVDITKSTAFIYYNILERLGQFEIYLGPTFGLLDVKSTDYNAPYDLSEMQKINPLLGGEIGANFYILRWLKISLMLGGYYGGDMEYAMKEATYWGEAQYKKKAIGLHPFYAGASLAFSLWPSLLH